MSGPEKVNLISPLGREYSSNTTWILFSGRACSEAVNSLGPGAEEVAGFSGSGGANTHGRACLMASLSAEVILNSISMA